MAKKKRDILKVENLDPPAHLSERSKELWTAYVGQRILSPGAMALFQSGLEAFDRSEEARVLIEKDGMITTTGRSGVSHINPLIQIEKESKNYFLKVWRTLSLQYNGAWDDPFKDIF